MTTEQMRALEPIVGKWRTSGRVYDADGTEVMEIEGTDEYEWMPGGHWVIHRVDVMMGDNHTRALELIGDPSADSTFVMRAFDASGAFDTMMLSVHDRTFHTRGDGVRNTLTVANDGASMAAVWEQQSDDKSWFHWMTIDFDRLG
jgi:hypothetical protein